MKRLRHVFTGALTGILVFSMCIGVFALSEKLKIEVAYDNIKIVIDGKTLNSKDAKGNTIEPFIYNGTTYLPVRAIGEAVGKEVAWDNVNKIVTLSAPGAKPSVGYSRTNPAPVGTEQTITIENYSEKYDAKVKINSVVRGKDALAKIIETNKFNKVPQEGKEYILVNATINVSNVKDDKAVNISDFMFDTFSASNVEYPRTSVVEPKPNFDGSIYSGATHTGYFVVEVDTNDVSPKLVFTKNYDGTGGIWFSLK